MQSRTRCRGRREARGGREFQRAGVGGHFEGSSFYSFFAGIGAALVWGSQLASHLVAARGANCRRNEAALRRAPL